MVQFILSIVICSIYLTGCGHEESDFTGGPGKNWREIANGTKPKRKGVGIVTTATSFCTAFEVGNRCIVTAAHCGKLVDYYSGTSSVAIKRFKPNPKFSSGGVAADIALAFTKKSKNVNWAPLSIGSRPAKKGDVLTIIGYGMTTKGTTQSILEGEMSVFSRQQTSVGGFYELTGTAKAQAVCDGDSGGPLLSGGSVIGVHSAINGKNCDPKTAWKDLAAVDTDLTAKANADFLKIIPAYCTEEVPDFEVEVSTTNGAISHSSVSGVAEGVDTNTYQTTSVTLTCFERGVATSQCKGKDITKVGLYAMPGPGFKFKKWTPINFLNECPCVAGSHARLCQFSADDMNNPDSKAGCKAVFEPSKPTVTPIPSPLPTVLPPLPPLPSPSMTPRPSQTPQPGF